ncbi:hypothetical protein BVG16_02060 [Paenibacillus selenitireducens]|uniref:L,D-TPase catalytic domain-containing protein n=1 Tax=Paenibacillus selenitireducens TaxID=1324314 RepID=A0A1T2XMR3_9BACL|nr:L,D-transpeptidase [Paenibacillus selenitireducens]OPA81141.1 hypothetical protein BVG16_02060 [Paenibacillus selenitireducens]
MKDILFLKRYVESHPDNRMAWYLLGKEYEATEQIGKANYCFNQAGDVYEAFEHTQIPAKWMLEAVERERALIQRQREKTIRRRWIGLAFLFLLLSGISGAPELPLPTLKLPQAGEFDATAERLPVIYVAGVGKKAHMAWENAISAHLASPQSNQHAIVVKLKEERNWLLWQHVPKIAGSINTQMDQDQEPGNKGFTVQTFDGAACRCEPSIPTATKNTVADWTDQMEEMQALRSAMSGYEKLHGKLPAALSDLTGSYPNNVIAGITPNMKAWYPAVKELLQSDNKAESLDQNMDPGFYRQQIIGDVKSARGVASTEDMLTEPFKIVIDKKNHRLAVVSGHILWRNYEVGLGGEKTPEGTFTISEKVKNPNGKSNGEFGSRGMTLSDTLYAIHGTNEPSSMGKDESHGCIRMRQQDVEELFDLVPMGTPVVIKKGVLPDTIVQAEQPFQVRPLRDQNQTNPHKVYQWLN